MSADQPPPPPPDTTDTPAEPASSEKETRQRQPDQSEILRIPSGYEDVEPPSTASDSIDSGYPVGDLRETVWDRYPGEYGPPTPEQRDAMLSAWEASASPDGWAQHVNPDKEKLGRQSNCADCTRAGESSWRGNPQVAAERLPQEGEYRGEPASRIEEWSGDRFQAALMDEIGHRLDEIGLGSSAMVAVDWGDGTGHAFNAFNEQGTVRYRDFQDGTSGEWPPPWGGEVAQSWAIYRSPEKER